MTTLARERREQRRWTARLRRPTRLYDALLENEFDDREKSNARIARTLGALLRFASQNVAYYRDVFRRAGVDPAAPVPATVLPALPILTKLDLRDHGSSLIADRLVPGEQGTHWTQTSGTTARPTKVLHSARSLAAFGHLKQREYRWFRLDPSGTFAWLRLPTQLPRRADGEKLGLGDSLSFDNWPNMQNFRTGRFVAANLLTPVEDLFAWVDRESPDYLMTYAQSLEKLAFAAEDQQTARSLKALISISEQLTPGMRIRVERSFGVPVHQNYGLNEIGLVAIRCEAGRYHVHTEHCLVEIVDERGHACAPGETGRIIVTALNNLAMPLIRYDTGDLAVATDGKCACNRTLPSFGEIVGRYARIAYLPPGTIGPVLALRETIEKMPPHLTRDFREFQIHQFLDRNMELRIVIRAALPEEFYVRVQAAWAAATESGGPELTVRRVQELSRAPGGKFEVFTSDFIPARDDSGTAVSVRA
jgi:phenylacetate-CoA ligase